MKQNNFAGSFTVELGELSNVRRSHVRRLETVAKYVTYQHNFDKICIIIILQIILTVDVICIPIIVNRI